MRREDLDTLGFSFFQLCCLLLVQAWPDHSALAVTHSNSWDLGRRMTRARQGSGFPCCELICVARQSLIMWRLDRMMLFWI